MSLPDDIFDALQTISELTYDGRVAATPDTFPQINGVPTVPAVRYTLVSGTVYPDACGNDEETGDPRYQFDVIHETPAERSALVSAVITALGTVPTPGVLQGLANNTFDAETKHFRATFDVVFHPSSDAPVTSP